MKNLKNRIVTILLITTLLIALFPIIPVNAIAVSTTAGVWNDSWSTPGYMDTGDYDDTIIVYGTGVTAGETVKIGWDGLQAWDGEKGILNSTSAKGSGAFEIWFDVPEAVVGKHYLWFKDMETGDTYKYDNAFVVIPRIKCSPSSGLITDKITLYGYGYKAEVDIDLIQFDDIYGALDALTTTPSDPETDELGSWECTFKVPHNEYGDRTVYAEDTVNNNDSSVEFTIGASITLDIEEGPVGTVVEIEGRGFTKDEVLDGDEVEIDGVACYITDGDTVDSDGEFKIECVIPSTTKADEYSISVTEDDSSPYASASEDFEVTGEAEIELDPQYGVQGSTISIEGWNFTSISGETVEIWLYDGATPVAEITDDIETESDGDIVGTFTVPAKSSDKYTIKAIQADYNIEASTEFQIGLMIVIPTPTSGPTGTEVTLTGTGFSTGYDWNATFGDILIIEDGDITGTDLDIGGDIPTFYVPTVDPGTYTISVLDIDSKISVDVDWTVTSTTMVDIDPMNAPNEYNVTITGSYFNADSDEVDVDLEFVLYNVTSDGEADEEWDVDVKMVVYTGAVKSIETVELDDDGNFTGYWVIEENDVLSLGDYILNVTASDADNIMTQGYLTIVAKSIIVEPRKSSFARGETVAFDIESTFTQHNSYVEIYDPVGDLYWTTDLLTDGEGTTEDMWLKVGEVETVPYYYQTAGGNTLLLLEDAPTGTWSWEWYDKYDDELDSGTFTVTAAAADVLSEQLTELNADLTELATNFEGVSTDVSSLSSSVSSLSDSVAQAIAAANAANSAVQDVAAAVASVADTASNAADAATAAAAAATSAKDAADSAGASASGLTNLVYGAIVAALVAALAAIVSLMQISRRIAG